MTAEKKFVYFFGAGASEGTAQMRDLLGGKGANLADMASLGLPVPPGFTITTEACAADHCRRFLLRNLPALDGNPGYRAAPVFFVHADLLCRHHLYHGIQLLRRHFAGSR